MAKKQPKTPGKTKQDRGSDLALLEHGVLTLKLLAEMLKQVSRVAFYIFIIITGFSFSIQALVGMTTHETQTPPTNLVKQVSTFVSRL